MDNINVPMIFNNKKLVSIKSAVYMFVYTLYDCIHNKITKWHDFISKKVHENCKLLSNNHWNKIIKMAIKYIEFLSFWLSKKQIPTQTSRSIFWGIFLTFLYSFLTKYLFFISFLFGHLSEGDDNTTLILFCLDSAIFCHSSSCL